MLKFDWDAYEAFFKDKINWCDDQVSWLLLHSIDKDIDFIKYNGILQEKIRDYKIVMRRIQVLRNKYISKEFMPEDELSELKKKMKETYGEFEYVKELISGIKKEFDV